jgi:hypothetical protein
MRFSGVLFSVVLISSLFFVSCSPLTPYTAQVKSEYGISDEDVEKIQFYISKDVVIYRAESGAQTQTTGGEVVVSSDRNTEQVVIEKGTKGILEKLEGNKIAIRFEPGDGKYLYFVSNSFQGRHVLEANWRNNVGELAYGGHKYYATASSRDAFLQFRVKKFKRDNKTKRKVGGMEVK